MRIRRQKFDALAPFATLRMAYFQGGFVELDQVVQKFGIRKIALLAVIPPAKLHTEDRTLAPPLLPTFGFPSIDDRSRRIRYDQAMESARALLGVGLTAKLLEEMNGAGFEVSLLEGVERSASNPDSVEYTSLPTRDAVLHVAFTEGGMASSMWSNDYEPRLNVRACLIRQPEAPDWLTSDYFYYGADSSGDTDWSIPTRPKYHYPSFDALLDRADEVVDAYEVATRAIAQRIAKRLRAQL